MEKETVKFYENCEKCGARLQQFNRNVGSRELTERLQSEGMKRWSLK